MVVPECYNVWETYTHAPNRSHIKHIFWTRCRLPCVMRNRSLFLTPRDPRHAIQRFACTRLTVNLSTHRHPNRLCMLAVRGGAWIGSRTPPAHQHIEQHDARQVLRTGLQLSLPLHFCFLTRYSCTCSWKRELLYVISDMEGRPINIGMGLFHRSSDERPKQVPGEP